MFGFLLKSLHFSNVCHLVIFRTWRTCMKFSISLTLFLSPFTVYFVICFSSLNGPNSFASTLLKKKKHQESQTYMFYVYKDQGCRLNDLIISGCRLGPLRQKVHTNTHTLMFNGMSACVSVENGKDFSPVVDLISVNF